MANWLTVHLTLGNGDPNAFVGSQDLHFNKEAHPM
jgi:hypothetical protein